jgi:WD repeat and SOF domain-containing protein 1
MRKLDHAICVHKDHVSAVLAVDYSPTGRQFVSGSYDRTVRIWNASELHSETVYHTKRMQRLFCVGWSMDASYLFSGSDDTNVRIWRAKANERATQPLGREKAKREYEEALVEKFKYVPEVKRIKKHTHVPRAILKARRTDARTLRRARCQRSRTSRRRYGTSRNSCCAARPCMFSWPIRIAAPTPAGPAQVPAFTSARVEDACAWAGLAR